MMASASSVMLPAIAQNFDSLRRVGAWEASHGEYPWQAGASPLIICERDLGVTGKGTPPTGEL